MAWILDQSQNTNIKLMYYSFLNTFCFMWTLIIMEGVQDLMTMLFFQKRPWNTTAHLKQDLTDISTLR